MSGKTENRLAESPAPVIPFVQKMGSQNTIPPIPDGKPITKENRGSLPIQFWLTVEDKSSMPSTKTQLPIDLADGVALTFLGGKAQLKTIASPHQKVSPFSFWGIPFLLVFGIACVAITAVMFLALSQNTKQKTETQTVSTPTATPIVAPAIKAANNLAKPEKAELKVDGLLPKEQKLSEEELDMVTTYEKPSELFELIADKEGAIRVYEEAVQLRKMAAKYENDEYRMRQAIIRLQALLRQSKLPEGYQRHAAKQLWIIYHCHLKWYKSAQEAESLMKKFNKRAAPNERVATICPIDGE